MQLLYSLSFLFSNLFYLTDSYEPHVIVEGETQKWERIAQAHMSSMMTKTSIPFAWFHENKEESKKQSG
ncbi:hypothetical protein P8452_76072 [Trifolium repens]|nr:hypothetical protein P8452_76072 [Trifolium repens]